MKTATGKNNDRVTFATKETMIAQGVHPATASMLSHSPSRNQLSAWYYGVDATKALRLGPCDKNKYNEIVRAMGEYMACDASGASRHTKLIPEAGIVVKMDINRWSSKWIDGEKVCIRRQSWNEWIQWTTATDEQRKLLCPIYAFSQGNDGKRSDHIGTSDTEEDNRCGSYLLTCMPFASDVNQATDSEVNALCVELRNAGLVAWDCRRANMGKVGGRWVLIDYGVE